MQAGEQGRFKRWLYRGVTSPEGPAEPEGRHASHPWWKVMCLTGVDYFSTLGYQPGIAFLAAGVLSPVATLILVLLTLFGALPIYSRVAKESPHGEGSIAMLEALLSRWKGKLFVLALLGFVATDFVITITLVGRRRHGSRYQQSFRPRTDPALEHPIIVTFSLIAVLGLIFLKGFKEAIGIAVVLVIVYLGSECRRHRAGTMEVATIPTYWRIGASHCSRRRCHSGAFNVGGFAAIMALSVMSFPRLALGLSGFETGVAVMPLVKASRTGSATPANY